MRNLIVANLNQVSKDNGAGVYFQYRAPGGWEARWTHNRRLAYAGSLPDMRRLAEGKPLRGMRWVAGV